VFAGLALPSHALGPVYVRTQVAWISWLLPSEPFAQGVRLRLLAPPELLAQHPWQATLFAERAGTVLQAMPIDLRSLCYLPCAAFVALSVATPLGNWRRNAKLLGIGLPILHTFLMALLTTPLLSFFGGTGPLQLFRLAPATHVVLQILYRALVAPPGMAFALPLLLWALLVRRV
jgi:hypothetical protein